MITQTSASPTDRAARRVRRLAGRVGRGALLAATLGSVLAQTGADPRLVYARSEPPISVGKVQAPSLDLAVWMAQLTAPDRMSREAAVSLIGTANAAMIPAIARRLDELARSANRNGMAAVLEKARRSAGPTGEPSASRSRDGRAGKAVDWFERLMSAPEPDRAEWRDLVSVLGLARVLVHLGTPAAVREVAAIYPRFGELLRADVERQMLELGGSAIPALIEQRRSEFKDARGFARGLLEMLGKSLPGEAVQTGDDRLLAEVLRAYGRAQDSDGASVIVAFANSDRAEVREAAREAVTMLGETGGRQLRESYENWQGRKPPADWGWDKVAAELFVAYDRSRLAEVYALMAEGLAAYERRSLEAAVGTFDHVLARAPAFERRNEMAPAYIDLARSLTRTDRARATATLRKALRVDPSGPRAREAESELVYLEAVDLSSRGIVDEAAYRRALDLNPDNAAAKEEMIRIQAASDARSASFFRWAVLVATVLSALMGAFAVLLWRGRRLPR